MRPVVGLLAVAVAIGMMLAYSVSLVAANVEHRFHGSYLVEFSVHDDRGVSAPVRTLATFTRGGQVIAADETDFGFLPEGGRDILAGCAHDPNAMHGPELNGPSFGTWSRRRMTLHFTVMAFRYATDTSTPRGFFRVRGEGSPVADGTLQGTSMIEFFGGDQDPIAAGSVPRCALRAEFVARKIPAEIQTRAFSDGD